VKVTLLTKTNKGSVELVDLTFSEPVTGVSASLLSLTKDGDLVDLAAIALTGE